MTSRTRKQRDRERHARETAITRLREEHLEQIANGRTCGLFEIEESLTEPGLLIRFRFGDGTTDEMPLTEELIAEAVEADALEMVDHRDALAERGPRR